MQVYNSINSAVVVDLHGDFHYFKEVCKFDDDLLDFFCSSWDIYIQEYSHFKCSFFNDGRYNRKKNNPDNIVHLGTF